MSNAAVLYLRLLRKIVCESAWRLGGADEILMASGFDRTGHARNRTGTAHVGTSGSGRETTYLHADERN